MTSAHACWLCSYASDPVAEHVCQIITSSVHTMSADVMAEQASELIKGQLERKGLRDVPGCEPSDVRRHIQNHMMHANVALGSTLRNLVSLNNILYRHIVNSAEGEESTGIDSRQLRDYLAVTSQITAIYKVGESNKLLFAQSGAAGGNGAAGST